MDLAKAKLLLPQIAAFSDTDLQLLQATVDAGVFTGPFTDLGALVPEVKGILSFLAVLKTLKLP